MIPLEVLKELFDYNYWARDCQLGACAALSQEQFLKPMGSSYSSVRDTLAHVMGAERIWLERWLGHPAKILPGVPGGLGFDETFRRRIEMFTSLNSIRDYWVGVESDTRKYLAGLDAQKLAQPMSYVSLQGKLWTYALWRTLVHVVNHRANHRGQVTTLLRQLGAKAAELDFPAATTGD